MKFYRPANSYAPLKEARRQIAVAFHSLSKAIEPRDIFSPDELNTISKARELLRKCISGAVLLMALPVFAQSNASVTVTVPAGSTIVTPSATNPAPASIMPPQVTIPAPTLDQERIHKLGLEFRAARFLAEKMAAPWHQRFIVTKAEPKFTDGETNYIVTLMPVPSGESNSVVAWGAVKARTIRMEMDRPVKKGDEFDFTPRTEREP